MDGAPRSFAPLLALGAIALGLTVLVGGAAVMFVHGFRTRPASSAATPAPSAKPSMEARAPVPPTPAPQVPGPLEAGSPAPLPALSLPLPTRATSTTGALGPIPVTEGRPVLGAAAAEVTLSLFGDLACPHTRRTLARMGELEKRHRDGLRVVFYQRPLGANSSGAEGASSLAIAAFREGPRAAWDLLVRSSRDESKPAPANPAPSASELRRSQAVFEEDRRLGATLDVRVTPTLFVNGTRLTAEPDADVLEALIQREQRAMRWLLAEGTEPARAYAKRVQRNLIAFDALAPDRACVPAGGAPGLGPEDALVTLVEFSGFECGPCSEMDAAIRRVAERHPREVRRVFRGLAPEEPARAHRMAAFAMSAQSELGDSAFWSLHRALRAAPPGLDDAGLLEVARGIGLPGERLLALSREEANERRLRHDLDLARALDVRGTPTLFVNGRLLDHEITPDRLIQVVTEELAVARRIAKAGIPPSRFGELSCRLR